MALPQGKFQYAQLPVFKYQTFDRESLKFSDHPIIPLNAKPPIVDDADDQKNGDGLNEPPIDPMPPPVEDVPVPEADPPAGKCTSNPHALKPNAD